MSPDARTEPDSDGLDRFPTWIQEAKAGSNEALGRALESCRGYLKIMAIRKLPRRLRAKESLSDLVQRTLQQAAKDFAAFRGNGAGEFRAWLNTILRTKALMVHRHFTTGNRAIDREVSLNESDGSRERHAQPLAKEPSPLEEILKREDIDSLKRALRDLEPEERRLIELFRQFQGDACWEQIGRELEISASAARSRLYRAIMKLRACLKRQHGQ